MNRNAALLVAGATAVGGFVLGKSVLDHYRHTQGEKTRIQDEDVEEFEEQHYAAAGFRKPQGRAADEVVAWVAGISGIAYTIYSLPQMFAELKQWAK